MSALLAALLFLFLPTASAIAMTCDANTRRSRKHRRVQPSPAVDASTPRTAPRGGSTQTDDHRGTSKAVAVPQSARNRAVTEPPADDTTTKNTTKDQTTDTTRVADKDRDEKKSSSCELEEKTCQDMAEDAEEATTQSMKPTDKEKTTTGPSPAAAFGTGVNASTHGGKSSLFEVVPSDYELDSVKRLHMMSKEPCNLTANATMGTKEVVVEMDKAPSLHAPPPPAEKPTAPSPSPKKKPKRDKKKEDEVRRWNAAIARGNVFRPRKDDETVDEVRADWGEPM